MGHGGVGGHHQKIFSRQFGPAPHLSASFRILTQVSYQAKIQVSERLMPWKCDLCDGDCGYESWAVCERRGASSWLGLAGVLVPVLMGTGGLDRYGAAVYCWELESVQRRLWGGRQASLP